MVADALIRTEPQKQAFAPLPPWARAWRQSRLILSASILVVIIGASLLGSWVAPYDANGMDLANALQPPSWDHWFGTDQLGRDVLSRTIVGGQLSLLLALSVVVLAGVSGTFLGLLAGYRGGWIDAIVMRIADIQYALPPVILAMVMVGAIGPSTINIVIVITLANWARFARVVRAEALTLARRDFVLLARLAGASHFRVVVLHILPNVRNTLLVLVTLDLGLIIILEATLSFLGLGIQPPNPSWGTMIADGRGYLERAWWTSILPGTVLMATVLAANLLSDCFRGGRTRGDE